MLTAHDPIVLAKQVSSLDRLSGGRFLFGVGPAWNEQEMRNHGTDPAHRFRVLRERVEAMRAIWANDEGEFHGRDVDFDPIWQPLPVLIGGNGPKAEDRVLRNGDGRCNPRASQRRALRARSIPSVT
jgi:alkanesulfonate monooxygenase SsuD/methylene tetrahydromethanopterin reductase-like flavin-dependent oxidoreductase (luciferase family)